MTVQSIDPQVIYAGDGVTRVFPFGFDMAAESTLIVSLVSASLAETIVPPSDYSINLFAQGGEVTFNVAPPDDVQVVVTRRTPITQQVSVTAQTAYDPRVVEAVWDKLTVLSQELAMAQATMLRGAPGTDPTGIYQQMMQAADQANTRAGDAETAKALAEAWASSPGEPEGPGTSSAKTEAGKARADALQTAADRIQTGLDKTQTGADRVATGADRVQTGLDRVATAADRVQTGLDRVATGADKTQTGLDRVATAADRVQTGQDKTDAENAKEAAETAAALANGMPIGTIMHFAADTPPDGWLVCDGTAVTALYPDLRTFLIDAGSPYGLSGADPLLPDLRGEFVRGWDGGRGVDAGRVFGTAQGDAIRNITGTFDPGGRVNGASEADFTGPFTRGTASRTSNGNASSDSRVITFDAGKVVPTASENRPRNVALLPCIRAYASVVNVPGQADLDHILQQTQVQVDDALVRVVGEATDAAMDKAAWKRVGKVATGTGAAVTLTGLDLTKETLIILSNIGCSATSAQTLRLRASKDGGASWLTASQPVSVSAYWSSSVLRGALEMFPDPDNNRVYTTQNTAAAAGGSQLVTAPAEFSVAGVAVLRPTCDTIEFSWSSGNFKVTAAAAPEVNCIIIYQRG